MPSSQPGQRQRRRQVAYITASILVHAALVGMIIGPGREPGPPPGREIAVTLRPAPEPEPAATASPPAAATPTAVAAAEPQRRSGSPATPGAAGGPPPVTTAAAPAAGVASAARLALDSVEFTELASLRASLRMPLATRARRQPASAADAGVGAAEPPIHLTESAIDRLLNEPTNPGRGGRGGGIGVSVGMGGGCSAP